MSASTDKAKGRIKHAIGTLTGYEKLKKQGEHDERAGRAKEKAGEVIDGVRDKIEDAAEALSSSKKEK